MEVLEMDNQVTNRTENHLNSAAAFVEGGLKKVPAKLSVSYVLAVQSYEGSHEELLEAVEQERKIQLRFSEKYLNIPSSCSWRFPVATFGATAADLEERIIQHLAAAAAMGRVRHHLGRRGGRRGQPLGALLGILHLTIQDGRGPSDLQSFSDSLKSRWNALSLSNSRYKDSIAKSTRGWRENFFARNTSMADPSPEVQREENEGVNSITRGLEHLEARENTKARIPSELSDDSANDPVLSTTNQRIAENQGNISEFDGSSMPPLAPASSLSY